MQRFYSNGKLLLSGEYLILDGATGIALPTTFGQEMCVKKLDREGVLFWESLDESGDSWFEGKFNLPNLKLISFTGQEKVARTLQRILLEAKKANSTFLVGDEGIHVTSKLQFPRDWGLGSSSTLINNIAQWSDNNPFELLFNSFGGSGYDIACAKVDQPITYALDHGSPKFESVKFDPNFKDQLYFVHLNKKQVSSESIKAYKMKKVEQSIIKDISILSEKLLSAATINAFNDLLKEHESIVSKILDIEPVQQRLFPDYKGQIKSLGAWGGDFILASGDESTKSYFSTKGFETIIPYTTMIKNS
jgi:mevalonate kinase